MAVSGRSTISREKIATSASPAPPFLPSACLCLKRMNFWSTPGTFRHITTPPWDDRADILLASLSGVSVTASGGIDSANALKGGLLWIPAGSKPIFKTAPAGDGHFIAITFRSRPASVSPGTVSGRTRDATLQAAVFYQQAADDSSETILHGVLNHSWPQTLPHHRQYPEHCAVQRDG